MLKWQSLSHINTFMSHILKTVFDLYLHVWTAASGRWTDTFRTCLGQKGTEQPYIFVNETVEFSRLSTANSSPFHTQCPTLVASRHHPLPDPPAIQLHFKRLRKRSCRGRLGLRRVLGEFSAATTAMVAARSSCRIGCSAGLRGCCWIPAFAGMTKGGRE